MERHALTERVAVGLRVDALPRLGQARLDLAGVEVEPYEALVDVVGDDVGREPAPPVRIEAPDGAHQADGQLAAGHGRLTAGRDVPRDEGAAETDSAEGEAAAGEELAPAVGRLRRAGGNPS